MRVAHILVSNKMGGAEKVAIDIIKLTSNKHFSMYLSRDGEIRESLTENKINNFLFKKINIGKIRRVLKQNDIDIIHAHDFKASVVSALFFRKYKIISHIHQSPVWLSKRNIKTKLFNYLQKYFEYTIVTSEEIKQSFPYENQFIVLPNYVNANCANPFETKRSIDFLFVGRLEPEKNPFKFVFIIEELVKTSRYINAVIVGSGSLYESLKEYIESKKLPIRMLGFLKNPYSVMNDSKFMIITSEKEGFSLVAIEAMQCGAIIITQRIGGVTELLCSSNSIIVEQDFIKEILNVLELLNKPYFLELKREESIYFGNKYKNITHLRRKIGEMYE
ncbi:glycosyltransferase [Vagococcus lutrae]|uniref:glycosyltransferase n=1 Tax=Vagococcus lutrae TaxID=81947 RepID=UPI002891BC58|nr:glycosyltransferase [Vagococcus lutrae]MDT2805868.1 glycosyltransferase [Vagococcus lutrae]